MEVKGKIIYWTDHWPPSMNKAHERPACGIRWMPNAHQRLPGPAGPASTTRDAQEFHGMEFCLPIFSGRDPVALPNTKEKPCIRWHICMSYAGIWKK